MNRKDTHGFTLVELLVVIGLIAILSSIVLASLSGARKNKSYVKRLSDVGQIDNAINRYQLSKSKYPSTNNTWYTSGTCASLSSTATSTYVPGLGIPLPTDPQKATNCSSGPMYAYKSNGYDYKIIVFNDIEDKDYVTKKNPERIDPMRPSTSTTPSFGFWTTAAAGW